ncbi:MAG: transcription elongation factor GreA [Patescibacteria group bacterium]|nr:transcription elongation factor GreA [Patescibacteria group bacterium]
MPQQVHYFSEEGLEKLKEELNLLKTVRVKETSARIESAKALGDLKENSEYHSAKEEMGFVQGRIREIEEILKNVKIIDESSGGDVVRVGSTVEVDSKTGPRSYKIVGSAEADPVNGLISNESPMGQSFLDCKVGDEVEVKTPGGIAYYTILKIQ